MTERGSEPRAAERRVPAWERKLRVVVYFAAFIPIFLGFEVAFRAWAMGWSLVRPAGREHRFNVLTRWWALSLCWLTRAVLGVRIEHRGRVPDGRFVVVSNHQSTVDIIFLIEALPSLNCKFVSKDSLGRYIPTVSTYLRHAGAALISRQGSRQDLAALAEMARGLRKWDGSAVIFAEGTRSRDGSLGSFRAAGTRVLARESGLPLLPACIEGTHPASDLSRFASGLMGARVIITIGEPVDAPEGGPQFQATLERIESWVEDTITRLRAETGQPAVRRPAHAAPERGEVVP